MEVERSFADYMSAHDMLQPGCQAVSEPSAASRLVVSIGGDGTFLKAVRWSGRRDIPVAGINTGHLGYLAPWTLQDANQLIDALESDSLLIDERTMLQVSAPGLDLGDWPYALNEVSMLKDITASMITVQASVNGAWLTDYLADGLVVATPTGSTAYSLSAGGPILQPAVRAFVLTPVAPHTLTMRSLVLGDDCEIEAKVESRSGSFMLSLDGSSLSLRSGTRLTLRRAPFCVKVARNGKTGFGATLRDKLLWGRQASNR